MPEIEEGFDPKMQFAIDEYMTKLTGAIRRILPEETPAVQEGLMDFLEHERTETTPLIFKNGMIAIREGEGTATLGETQINREMIASEPGFPTLLRKTALIRLGRKGALTPDGHLSKRAVKTLTHEYGHLIFNRYIADHHPDVLSWPEGKNEYVADVLGLTLLTHGNLGSEYGMVGKDFAEFAAHRAVGNNSSERKAYREGLFSVLESLRRRHGEFGGKKSHIELIEEELKSGGALFKHPTRKRFFGLGKEVPIALLEDHYNRRNHFGAHPEYFRRPRGPIKRFLSALPFLGPKRRRPRGPRR